MGNEAASAKEFDAVRGLQKKKQEGSDLAMKMAATPTFSQTHGLERCGFWFACQFRGGGGGKLSVRGSVDRSVFGQNFDQEFSFPRSMGELARGNIVAGHGRRSGAIPGSSPCRRYRVLAEGASAGDVVAAVRAISRGEVVCPPQLCMRLVKRVSVKAREELAPGADSKPNLTRGCNWSLL